MSHIPHEIHDDGKTVWVNGVYGLLGRFGVNGIDIHRPMNEQMERGEYLHYTYGPTTRNDWDVFVTKMAEHFGIHVPDEHMPIRFRVKQ